MEDLGLQASESPAKLRTMTQTKAAASFGHCGAVEDEKKR